MKRIYQTVLENHLAEYRQMAFLSGPRQVGKTTLSIDTVKEKYQYQYLNWDDANHRELILSGIQTIYQQYQPDLLKTTDTPPIVIFDEIHKYTDWKTMLKGYFDTIQQQCKIMVTGSAKLNVYRRGGDSMMGRYFLYRIHPFSVAEILGREDFSSEITLPKQLSSQQWENLIKFGGFPEPYLNASDNFYRKWNHLKQEQLFQEDLRDLSKVRDLSRLELLAQLLTHQVSSTTKYSELAKKVRVSEPTIRNWIDILCSVYYCFSIPPWTKNISRSLLKEPKIYLWDWSVISNEGARIENLIASHLRKAIHFWIDIGLGEYDLYYLRDKDKKEVDFLVTKNGNPWLMVESETSNNGRLGSNINYFNQQINVPHVLQVVKDLPYIEKDCFALERPMIVPLLTFLSQLV